MKLDIKRVMILLQRKYTAIIEINRLTKELEETFARNDEVSAVMVLQMRGDEMGKADQCDEELWQLGEESREVYEQLRILMTPDPEKAVGSTKEEEKIYEIRRKTKTVIEELRRRDQRLNQRVAGKNSYYKTAQSVG